MHIRWLPKERAMPVALKKVWEVGVRQVQSKNIKLSQQLAGVCFFQIPLDFTEKWRPVVRASGTVAL